jgi:hypothetical protein
MTEMLGPSRDCIRCGETFLLGRLGRKALYCSRNCRQRTYEDRRALALLAPMLTASPGYAPKKRRSPAASGDKSRPQAGKKAVTKADDHGNDSAPDPKAEG